MPPKKDKETAADLGPTLTLLPLSQARIDEYFGTWNIEERRGQLLEQTIQGIDLAAHAKQFEDEKRRRTEQAAGDNPGRAGYELNGGVAVIKLEGTLMKQDSSFGGTSTVNARRAVKNAAADPNVGGILLVIDSPGGTSAGTGDLADAVHAAAQVKPTWAFAEDCCCSAAYFVASQAEKVLANNGAAVGSIGTYMVVRDLSGMYAQKGIKTHVVKAGAHKGTGTAGTEVTAEQLAELQQYVNDVNANFVAAVARGRKLTPETAQALADGSVSVGQAAVAKKLIDGVQSLDQTLADLQKLIQQKKQGSKPVMSDENKPKAATIGELKAACPGCSADFIVAQQEIGATVPAAQTAYIGEQAKQITALTEAKNAAETKLAEAVKQTDTKGKGAPGVKALNEDPKQKTDEGDAKQRVETAVKEKMASGMSRHEAMAAVFKADDALRQAYVEQMQAA